MLSEAKQLLVRKNGFFQVRLRMTFADGLARGSNYFHLRWTTSFQLQNTKLPGAAKPHPKTEDIFHHEVIHELTLARRR